jgi:chromosome segregation ATPase
MGRYTDNAPIRHTCPIIDNVIGKMESAKYEAECISEHSEEDSSEYANTIRGELIDAINEIEDVRSANSELRAWGNEECNRAEEAEGERDEAIRDKEYLQEEIDELKAKIEELETQLSEVEMA